VLRTSLFDEPLGGASVRGTSEVPADNNVAASAATSSASSQPPATNTSKWLFSIITSG